VEPAYKDAMGWRNRFLAIAAFGFLPEGDCRRRTLTLIN
jgi:hypothetical protein